MAARVVTADTSNATERDGDDVGFTSAILAYLEDKVIGDEEIYNGVKYANELHSMAELMGEERDRNAWLCGKTLSCLGDRFLSKSTQESIKKILTNLVQRMYDKAEALLQESLKSVIHTYTQSQCGVGMYRYVS